MTTTVRPLAAALAVLLAAGTANAATPRTPVTAPAPRPAPQGGFDTPDYHIDTNRARYSLDTGDFTMPEKVHLTRPGTDAIADSAHGNSKLGTATLIGHVVVHDSGNAPEAAGVAPYRGSGPATLTCDQLDIDARAKLYTATGHVHFTQGTSRGTADKAVLNRANGNLHLEGDVHLSQNGSTISAQAIDYNLISKDADVQGSPVKMTQPVANPAPPPRPAEKPAAKPHPAATRKP